VVGAVRPVPVGHQALVQRQRLLRLAGHPVGVREFAARGQGVGVRRSQRPLPAGQGLLERGDGLVALSRFEIGLAQAFAGGQGVWVPGPPALLGFGENALGEADRLLGAASRYARARLPRAVTVSGWAAPSSRCRSSSAAWYTSTAASGCPAASWAAPSRSWASRVCVCPGPSSASLTASSDCQ
jgi:hypothetical protein